MSELQTIEGTEVVSELEFRALQANAHYRNAGSFARRTLEEAIACGEHLSAARDLFSPAEIAAGEWGRWLDDNFDGSPYTAGRWVRLYNSKPEIEVRRGDEPLTITAALRMLAAPKDEQPETKTGDQQGDDQQGDDQQGDDLTAIQQQAEEDRLQKMRQELDAREKAIADLERQRLEVEALENSLKAERETFETLEEKIQQDHTKAAAELKAKYYGETGDSDKPEWSNIPDEAWYEAFSEARDMRLASVGKLLRSMAGEMRAVADIDNGYLAGEAAKAIGEMSGGDRLIADFRSGIEWLERVIEETEAIQRKEVK
jgi:hypothetical protein